MVFMLARGYIFFMLRASSGNMSAGGTGFLNLARNMELGQMTEMRLDKEWRFTKTKFEIRVFVAVIVLCYFNILYKF